MQYRILFPPALALNKIPICLSYPWVGFSGLFFFFLPNCLELDPLGVAWSFACNNLWHNVSWKNMLHVVFSWMKAQTWLATQSWMNLLARSSINTDNIFYVNERKYENKKRTLQSDKLLKAAVGLTNADVSWKIP